jgi:hypothetical protein
VLAAVVDKFEKGAPEVLLMGLPEQIGLSQDQVWKAFQGAGWRLAPDLGRKQGHANFHKCR